MNNFENQSKIHVECLYAGCKTSHLYIVVASILIFFVIPFFLYKMWTHKAVNIILPERGSIVFKKFNFDMHFSESLKNIDTECITRNDIDGLTVISLELNPPQLNALVELLNSGAVLSSPLKAVEECEVIFHNEGSCDAIYEVSLSAHIFRRKDALNKNIQVDQKKLLAIVFDIILEHSVPVQPMTDAAPVQRLTDEPKTEEQTAKPEQK